MSFNDSNLSVCKLLTSTVYSYCSKVNAHYIRLQILHLILLPVQSLTLFFNLTLDNNHNWLLQYVS